MSRIPAGCRLTCCTPELSWGDEPDLLQLHKRVCTRSDALKFSELVRILESNGFRIVKEKGSIRYYGKPGWT